MGPSNSVYCVVLPWSFNIEGGVNQVVNNLLTELQVAVPRPLALQLDWNSPKPSDFLPSGVEWCYLRLRPPFVKERPIHSVLAYLAHAPGELLALHRLVRDRGITTFNVHFPNVGAINFVLLKALGLARTTQLVLSVHGSDIRAAYQERGVMSWLWRVLLRNANAVVACSHGLREEVLMVEPRARAVTIHNGINFQRFTADTNPNFEWPPDLRDKRIIVKVSSFEYRKGHDILLQAFRQVADQHPEAVLLLVGKAGPVSGEIRKSIRELELEDRVFIFENVPHQQIYDLLTRAELFVLATRWRKGQMGEGFSIAVLEAAVAKVPIVSTASCGVEEIIENNKTGRVVPLENPNALAAAISAALNDPESSRGMAERLEIEVRDRFTWARAAEQYRQLSDTHYWSERDRSSDPRLQAMRSRPDSAH